MMNEQLESDLHEMFSVCASAVPADAGMRLRGMNYRPRTHRMSPRLTAGALAGAAVTTGAVVSVVVLGSAQAAFAGWVAAPTTVAAAPASTAAAACQAQLTAMAAAPGAAIGSDWSPVATDVRGPFTLVVYSDGSNDATCLTGPSITVVSANDGGARSVSGGSSTIGAAGKASGKAAGGVVARASMITTGAGSGSIKEVSVAHLSASNQGPFTVVDGQVNAGVTGVALIRSDGKDVRASTGNGWFVAWWPGSAATNSAQITTAAGVATEPLPLALVPPSSGNTACEPNSQTTTPSLRCGEADSRPRASGSGPRRPRRARQ
jgi:hypothetical protein